MLRHLGLACALACLAAPVWAQNPEKGVKRGITVEAGGGYAYTEFNTGQGFPNANGFYGSVGINVSTWLQVYGEGSAQFGSISGGNTRIYGDHAGARFYYHPWSGRFNPFGEFLVGASRLDLNIAQPTQHFSQNGFSLKAGGGLDWQVTPHWYVRAFDVDYYRTPFLQSHQNNTWISAGVVFRFGNHPYPR